MTWFERILIAAAMAAVSGGVTFCLGGSDALICVLAAASFVMTLLGPALVEWFGWGEL